MAAIAVRGLDHCRAALAAARASGRAVTLVVPADVVATLGPMAVRAMLDAAQTAVPGAPFRVLADCGDAPGLALNALRHRIDGLILNASPEVFGRLRDIARASGAVLIDRAPSMLDLTATDDPESACRIWIDRLSSAE